MKITLVEVKQKYIDLIDDKISREEANLWAYSFMEQEELGNLIYFPPEDEEKIWQGITFLYGIDLQDKPGEYLHIKKDIIREFGNLC